MHAEYHGKKENKERKKAHLSRCFAFQNAASFAEEKIHLVTCPPDTLELFCWCFECV
jgi:hypothetical protein